MTVLVLNINGFVVNMTVFDLNTTGCVLTMTGFALNITFSSYYYYVIGPKSDRICLLHDWMFPKCDWICLKYDWICSKHDWICMKYFLIFFGTFVLLVLSGTFCFLTM